LRQSLKLGAGLSIPTSYLVIRRVIRSLWFPFAISALVAARFQIVDHYQPDFQIRARQLVSAHLR
jgi:hypothetical protein